MRCFDEDGDDRNLRFFVARQRETLRTIAFVVIGIGVVILLGSFFPLFTGIQGRSASASGTA